MTYFDLRRLRLRSGEQFRDTRTVVLEPLELGGQRYVPSPSSPDATLTITRAASGLVFRLELESRLEGPCVRCLGEAAIPVRIDATEYQASNPGGTEELATPYLVDDRLDLSQWARDAVALSLPEQIVCREDCAGICPT
jgi:uncharacterized protein